jgi:hypothetical protein
VYQYSYSYLGVYCVFYRSSFEALVDWDEDGEGAKVAQGPSNGTWSRKRRRRKREIEIERESLYKPRPMTKEVFFCNFNESLIG